MKILKIVSVIAFAAAVILFGGYMLKEGAKDKTGPVITVESDNIEVSVSEPREALLQGVTATDAHDGDVTASVRVESLSPFNESGERTVSYVAFDSDGHVSHAARTMRYTDYTPPKFRFDGPLTYPSETKDLMEKVTVTDCIDGDLTELTQILFDTAADTTRPGVYTARLKITNSAGDSEELPVTIEIFNPSFYYRLPAINLKEQVLYLKKGDAFDAAGQLQSAVIDGIEYTFVPGNGTYGSGEESGAHTIDISRAAIEGSVDTGTAGCYEVTYTLEDPVTGTGTGTARLYVVVTEGGTK